MQIEEIDHAQQYTHATSTINSKDQIFWWMIAAVFRRDSLSSTGNFGGMFRSAAVPWYVGVRVLIRVRKHAHRSSVKAKLEERDWYLRP